MSRVVSLGLDGAAWHALEPMMADGELPNLARLAEDGARGPLESVRPPVTCPAWRCSTSGKNPGKLGVYWWLTLDRNAGELDTPDARSFDTPDVWNYLSDAGLSSAVLNVPMTYPPEDVEGVMVAGFGAPFDLDVDGSLTSPPELHDHVREEYGWRIGVDDVTAPDGPEAVRDLIRSRFELLLDLLDTGRYDYLHLTVFYVNVLQHKYGDGPETRRAWRLIDDYLGELPEDVLTVIYSDHGHGPIEHTFVVNRYLAERGYLSFDGAAEDSLGERLYTGMKSVGISPREAATTVRTLLPERLYDLLAPEYPVSTAAIAERADWAGSTALAVSQGPVFLNRDRLGGDYEAVREELAAELEGLTHRGEPVLEAVHRPEAIYHGGDLAGAPDLLLVPAEGWEVYGGLTPDTFESQVTSWTSGNDREGVLLLHGDDVAPVDLGRRSLLDVMPTVLRYLGCRVPTDVDGEAVAEPFDRGALTSGWRDPLDAGTGPDPTDDRGVQNRLQELGYLE